MNKFLVPNELIETVFNLETLIFFSTLLLLSYSFYRIFLKKISEKRHRNLKARFKSLPLQLVILFSIHFLNQLVESWGYFENLTWAKRFSEYVLLFGVFFATFVLVKIFQVLVYCYLFFVNMSHGIPRLVANMTTFFFSIFIFGSLLSYLFKINIAALATTSAVFSIILGLALQDTIGNLFSGLSLQLDKSLQIGDWIEVNTGTGTSWTGQIQEITWRATYLIGFSNEVYMVPNRLIAQAKVSFQTQDKVSRRLSHDFRFSYNQDFSEIKKSILSSAEKVEGLCANPPPRVLILETLESSLRVGVFYSIHDYAKRFIIGDQMMEQIQKDLHEKKIAIQVPSLEIIKV